MLGLTELVLLFPHHVMVELCYLCMHVRIHHITLKFEQFICHAICKKVVTLLINFLCSVVFWSVVFWCVAVWCVVLFVFFVLHLCCVGSIHYHAILHERSDIAD